MKHYAVLTVKIADTVEQTSEIGGNRRGMQFYLNWNDGSTIFNYKVDFRTGKSSPETVP